MSYWYEVYECENPKERIMYGTIAFVKHENMAKQLARYYPTSKVRIIRQTNTWEWEEKDMIGKKAANIVEALLDVDCGQDVYDALCQAPTENLEEIVRMISNILQRREENK
jgi:hypothetical protein